MPLQLPSAFSLQRTRWNIQNVFLYLLSLLGEVTLKDLEGADDLDFQVCTFRVSICYSFFLKRSGV